MKSNALHDLPRKRWLISPQLISASLIFKVAGLCVVPIFFIGDLFFMKKAVVFLADGFEEVEAITPIDYLRRAKVEVVLVSINMAKDVISSHNVHFVADKTLAEYLSSESSLPDCIFFPGGLNGSRNLSECREVLEYADKMNDEGKLVSAICAAPALVLSRTKCLAGKKWTCYPDDYGVPENLMKNRVADVPFVVSENLITGCSVGCAEQFTMELVKVLAGEAECDRIRKGTIQR